MNGPDILQEQEVFQKPQIDTPLGRGVCQVLQEQPLYDAKMY